MAIGIIRIQGNDIDYFGECSFHTADVLLNPDRFAKYLNQHVIIMLLIFFSAI